MAAATQEVLLRTIDHNPHQFTKDGRVKHLPDSRPTPWGRSIAGSSSIEEPALDRFEELMRQGKKVHHVIQAWLQFVDVPDQTNERGCNILLIAAKYASRRGVEFTVQIFEKVIPEFMPKEERIQQITRCLDERHIFSDLRNIVHQYLFMPCHNYEGDTALHLICREVPAQKSHKFKALASRLIKDGLNPNFQNSKGKTALHIAAQKGHHSLVRALVKHGAKRMVQDHEGKTPFELARGKGFSNIVQILSS